MVPQIVILPILKYSTYRTDRRLKEAFKSQCMEDVVQTGGGSVIGFNGFRTMTWTC